MMPQTPAPPDGQLAQVLIKLGELSTSMAVIGTKLDAIPVQDFESRLRGLERFKWALMGAALGGGGLAGWVAAEAARLAHP